MSERDIHLFTSESVTEGHPDKVADQISDAILDEVLRHDPRGRVACETTVTTGMVLLAGEISTSAYVDFAGTARRVVREIGYTKTEFGSHHPAGARGHPGGHRRRRRGGAPADQGVRHRARADLDPPHLPHRHRRG